MARRSRRPALSHPRSPVRKAARYRPLLERLEDRWLPSTLTVVTADDDGAGSLRQAILDANANPGPDRIEFAIGSGLQTLTPQSPLPSITDPVTIDGTTQPDFTGSPVIELNGAQAGGDGLSFSAGSDGSAVRGLVINRFSGSGIVVAAANVDIEGNFIGTDDSGTAAAGNGTGISVFNTLAQIGGTTPAARNVISGNQGTGLFLQNATFTTVQGNFIGTDATGAASLGNGSSGIELINATDSQLGGVSDASSGSLSGAGNLIAGNGGDGVTIDFYSHRTIVQGNFIGTDITGSLPLGNVYDGVTVSDSSHVQIGGTDPGVGNVLAASGRSGVMVLFPDSAPTTIQGNRIGTDRTGTAALGNRYAGVEIVNGAGVLIGGSTPAARNVISASTGSFGGYGVTIYSQGSHGNVVQGNYIGTTADGSSALGNAASGVQLWDGAGGNTVVDNVISANGAGVELSARAFANQVQNNRIGTAADGMSALGNLHDGIFVDAAQHNVIAGNVIGASGQNGISLFDAATGNVVQGNDIGTDATGTVNLANSADGVSVSSASGNPIGGAADGQGNTIANNGGYGVRVQDGTGNPIRRNQLIANAGGPVGLFFSGNLELGAPSLDAAFSDGERTTVTGSYQGAADTTYVVELFTDSGLYVDSLALITDSSGDATFGRTLAIGLTPGQTLAATATDPNANTSTLSPAVTVLPGMAPGGVAAAGVTVTSTEGSALTNVLVAAFTDSDAGVTAGDVSVSIDWGDGTPLDGSGTVTGSTGHFTVSGSHTYAVAGPYTVTVTVHDTVNDTNDTTYTTAIVLDAALDSVPGGPTSLTAVEGTSTGLVELARFRDSDPAAALSLYSATIDWSDYTPLDTGTVVDNGDGTFSVFGQHVYTEESGFGPYPAHVTVHDAHGATLAALSPPIAVEDAALTVVDTASPFSASAGVPFTTELASFTDGNPLSTVDDYTRATGIDWGDGTFTGNPSITSSDSSDPSVQPFHVSGTHAYAAAGVYTVTIYMVDLSSIVITTTTVTVATAGSLSATGTTLNGTEGAALVGEVATFTDPVPGAPGDYSASIDWGDGDTSAAITITQDGSDPTLFHVTATKSSAYAEEGSYAITVQITRTGSGSATASSSAVVADAPLNVTPPAVSAVENQLFSDVVTTFTDPGGAEDPGEYSATIDWGNGPEPAAVSVDGGVFQVSGAHTFAEEGNYPITVAVTHGGQTFTADGMATVADSPLVLGVPAILAPEGQPFSGLVVSFTDQGDPDGPSDYSATIDWGNGPEPATVLVAGSVFQVSGDHTFADEGSYPITVAVTHGGQMFTATGTASVADLPLTLGVPVVNTVEGQAYGDVVLTFTDQGDADASSEYSATIDWGAGEEPAAVSFSAGTFSVSGAHQFAEEGAYPITVRVTHGGQTFSSGGTVQVEEAPLTLATPSATSTESQTLSGVVATFTDAGGAEDLAEYSATIDWGSGEESASISQSGATFSVSGSHAFAEEGVYPLTVRVTHGGQTFTRTGAATVADAPLSGTAIDTTQFAGFPFAGVTVASFTDAGGVEPAGHYSATIDWGDGTSLAAGTVSVQGSAITVSGDHIYATLGSYPVTVTLHDDGSVTSASSTALVLDASAGAQDYPVSGQYPYSITLGPDGNLWFTEQNAIGRVRPAGGVTEFPLPTPDSFPTGITAGPDGALWFTEYLTSKIGRIDLNGQITEYALPTGTANPDFITRGPDGNLWFTFNLDRIGVMDPAGNILHQYIVPTPASRPYDITVGADGAIWFGELLADQIGRIDPATGTVTEFPAGTDPHALTVGPDGTIWFTGNGTLNRITPDGGVTRFRVPAPHTSTPGVTFGPDRALWVTEFDTGLLARFDSGTSTFTEYPLPTSCSGPLGITAGPNHDLWFTEFYANQIGRFVPGLRPGRGPLTAVLLDSPAVHYEGQGLSDLLLTVFNDRRASLPAGAYTATVDWGDGSPVESGLVRSSGFAAGEFEVHGSHTFREEGTYHIQVTITDGTFTVEGCRIDYIFDAPLTAGESGGPLAATQGAAFSASVLTFTDANPEGSAAEFTATVDWGDGQTSAGTVSGSDSFTVTAGHTYANPGTFTATVTIYDAGGATLSATQSVLVVPALPVANDDAATTNEDTAASINVLANDSDPLHRPLSITITVPPTHGVATVDEHGTPNDPTDDTVTYVPAADYNGTDTFRYRVSTGSAQSGEATVTVTVRPVNDPPSFTAGANVTVLEDAGPQTAASWATGIRAGPPNEAGQALTFLVTGDDNPGLFASGPAIDPATGNLTFTSAANANGTAHVTFVLRDNGGTANGGSDTSVPATLTITVIPVNDSPTFADGGNVTVAEDPGPQALVWAHDLSAGPPDEAEQHLTFLITGNTNPGLFAAAPALATTGLLSFTPAANANGFADLSVVLQDDGGTANGGSDTSAVHTLRITVSAVNDPPVNTVPGAQIVPAGGSRTFSASGGNGIRVDDVDGAEGTGIEQLSLSVTQGTLTLSTTAGLTFSAGDGVQDAAMTFRGTLSALNAALDGLVYTPVAGYQGVDTLTVTSNDLGNTGAGGPLTDTDSIQLTVGKPDIVMTAFQGYGLTTVAVSYQITTNPLPVPFTIGFYAVTGTTISTGNVPLCTVTLSGADLSLGAHVKQFALGTDIVLPGAGAPEAERDYHLLAVADPQGQVDELDRTNNTALFTGAYHLPGGDVFVHGNAAGPQVNDVILLLPLGSVDWLIVNTQSFFYVPGDVTAFRVRSHAGDDNITDTTGSYLRVWGGAGNDSLSGGGGLVYFNGGVGTDRIIESGNTGFLLTNTLLQAPGVGSYTLSGIAEAYLTDTGSGHTFDVSGWTGTGQLTGPSSDTVRATVNSHNFTLSDTALTIGNGPSFTLSGLGLASLTALGTGRHIFTVSGWSGGGSLTGTPGTDDRVVATKNDVSYVLSNAALTVSGSSAMALGLANIPFATLTVTGNASHNFTVSGWTGGGSLVASGPYNNLSAAKDAAQFQLTDTSFTTSDGTALGIGGFGSANLQGGSTLDNTFDLRGWNGLAILSGRAGGINTVIASSRTKNESLTLSPTSLTIGARTLLLVNITVANLFATGGFHRFDVSTWNGTGLLTGVNSDHVVVTRPGAATFTLTDTGVTATGSPVLFMTLSGIGQADLSGSSGSIFNVTGWSGGGSLTGVNGGPNTVVFARDVNQTLSDGQLVTSDGTNFTLSGITQASLAGGPGNNQISASQFSGATTLSGGAGNDTLAGGVGADCLLGGSGDDLLQGSNGADVLHGDDGNDVLAGGSGNDTLDGGAGTDMLMETTSFNLVLSNTALVGSNTLGQITDVDSLAGIEQANLAGGPSDQLFDATAFTGPVTLSGAAGADTLRGSLTAPSSLDGGAGADSLVGGNANDTLAGGADNDTLTGGLGDDLLNGGAGNNNVLKESGDVNFHLLLSGLTGLGTDLLASIQLVSLTGGPSNNTFDLTGAQGTVTLAGGGGTDTVVRSTSGTLTLSDIQLSDAPALGTGVTATLVGVRVAQLTGDAQNNTFVLSGWTGSGSLSDGGGGVDTVVAVKPNDMSLGSAALTATDGMNITLNAIKAARLQVLQIAGGVGHTLDASQFGYAVTLTGGNGDDTLLGGKANDSLVGNGGDDVLVGGTGDDTLLGGDGRDLLIGDGGIDSLSGGNGEDILIGAATAFDTNNAALTDAMREWTRTDANYSTRIQHLLGGTGGLNKTAYLNPSTVTDDGQPDTLNGDAGLDWFFAHIGSDNYDAAAETITRI